MAVEIEIGGVLAGYRVERLLGSGAMGAVYLSEDIHLRRKVAVKVLTPELAADERFRKRFLVESQLAASLDHPNIVPIYAAGEDGGLLYLAMRYVEGYDLRDLVDSTPGGLDPAQAVRLLGPVADALDAAHALGLVHRDVKPANVMLADDGEVKLLDFGLAKLVETDAQAASTSLGMTFGDPRYMSPEQARGDQVSTQSDLFSAAAVMFELFTGEKLFPGEEADEIIRNIDSMALPKPSAMRAGLHVLTDSLADPCLVMVLSRNRPRARRPGIRSVFSLRG